jgi:hypothetical protein
MRNACQMCSMKFQQVTDLKCKRGVKIRTGKTELFGFWKGAEPGELARCMAGSRFGETLLGSSPHTPAPHLRIGRRAYRLLFPTSSHAAQRISPNRLPDMRCLARSSVQDRQKLAGEERGHNDKAPHNAFCFGWCRTGDPHFAPAAAHDIRMYSVITAAMPKMGVAGDRTRSQ